MSNRDVLLGEFIGTALLVLLGVGVAAGVRLPGSKARDAGWVATAFGWGFAMLAAAYAVLPLSGGHLNPAVTLGKAVALDEWTHVPLYLPAQLLGAIAGATLAWLAYLAQFRRYRGPTLVIFAAEPAIRSPLPNLLTEAIATFVLVSVVLALGETRALAETPTDLLIIGLVVTGIGLSLGGPTGYAFNPARDLGARIAHALLPHRSRQPSDWSYAWIPVLGPSAGALLAGLLDRVLFR